MGPRVEVCWLLSPIRSGSSVTAYGAADALGCNVADEIFGPWDRTGPPYNYPGAQRRLRDVFAASGERLTTESVELAGRVLHQLGRLDGLVICKHPHASIGPEEIRTHWPGHHCAVLLRNPLKALNSLYVRGWEQAAGGGSMIGYFATIAERWLADPNRLLYEDLRRDPCGYFRRLFRAWGFGSDEGLVQRAVRYGQCAYHSSSGEKHAGDDPSRVRSEQEWRLPAAIVDEYLAHPLMREVFGVAGWPLDRAEYLAPDRGEPAPASGAAAG